MHDRAAVPGKAVCLHMSKQNLLVVISGPEKEPGGCISRHTGRMAGCSTFPSGRAGVAACVAVKIHAFCGAKSTYLLNNLSVLSVKKTYTRGDENTLEGLQPTG